MIILFCSVSFFEYMCKSMKGMNLINLEPNSLQSVTHNESENTFLEVINILLQNQNVPNKTICLQQTFA